MRKLLLTLLLWLAWSICVVLAISSVAPDLRAQNNAARGSARATKNVQTASTEQDVAAARQQLIELLRLSPKMVPFVARDPLLLSDPQYVNRNNPQLAAYLDQHPEVARNPEFYLFAEGGPQGRQDAMFLDVEREIWPELRSTPSVKSDDVMVLFVFIMIFSGLLWLLRVLFENRRWSRTFNVQTDIYNKLLDKFSSNEEMLAYMRSESGRRFLESAVLPQVPQVRGSSAVSRVLTPLQVGVVVTLLGAGLLHLRSQVSGTAAGVGALGTLALAVGVGFIISAALAWGLARHLGITPTPAAASGATDEANV